MAGDGTRDIQLIRMIVTRSEKDLKDIEVAFLRLTGKSLKQWIKGRPTVVPAKNIDPNNDAEGLWDAMTGFTNKSRVTGIICRRSNEQRQEIQRAYRNRYDSDLAKDIESNWRIEGKFMKLLVSTLTPPITYYTQGLHWAIETDQALLVEMLATLSNQEIRAVNNKYIELYKKTLQASVKADTTGNFGNLVLTLAYGVRYAEDEAKNDFDRPKYVNIEMDHDTTPSKLLIHIMFGLLSRDRIKWITEKYPIVFGETLEQAIGTAFARPILDTSLFQKLFSWLPFVKNNPVRDGLSIILEISTNISEFYAGMLRDSLSGIGSNDERIIRVIISRSEKDMQDIKEAFQRLYGTSLKAAITEDNPVRYFFREALLVLIGEY